MLYEACRHEIYFETWTVRTRDSSVNVVTAIQAGLPRNRGSVPGRVKRYVSPSKRPGRPWVPPNFLVSDYWKLLPRWGGGAELEGA